MRARGIDYDEYAEQVKKLLDKHVVGVEVKEPGGVYEVGKMGQKQQPEDWSEDENPQRNRHHQNPRNPHD